MSLRISNLKMVKDKAKEHGLEYVILKSDQEEQLWEIDYDKGFIFECKRVHESKEYKFTKL